MASRLDDAPCHGHRCGGEGDAKLLVARSRSRRRALPLSAAVEARGRPPGLAGTPASMRSVAVDLERDLAPVVCPVVEPVGAGDPRQQRGRRGVRRRPGSPPRTGALGRQRSAPPRARRAPRRDAPPRDTASRGIDDLGPVGIGQELAGRPQALGRSVVDAGEAPVGEKRQRLGAALLGDEAPKLGVARGRPRPWRDRSPPEARASPARARGRGARRSGPREARGSGRRETSRGWSTRRSPASRSALPPWGSISSGSPKSGSAIAFTVKSRRARSSASDAGSTVGQRAGMRVGLARVRARCRRGRPPSVDRRGAEPLVRLRLGAEAAPRPRPRRLRPRRRDRPACRRRRRSRTAPPTSHASMAGKLRAQLVDALEERQGSPEALGIRGYQRRSATDALTTISARRGLPCAGSGALGALVAVRSRSALAVLAIAGVAVAGVLRVRQAPGRRLESRTRTSTERR